MPIFSKKTKDTNASWDGVMCDPAFERAMADEPIERKIIFETSRFEKK